MSHRDVDLAVLRATLAKVGDPFRTKDVSSHPDMLRAHPALARQRNYHAFVGRCLATLAGEVTQLGQSNERGALWTLRPGAGAASQARTAGGAVAIDAAGPTGAPPGRGTERARAAGAAQAPGALELGPQCAGDDAFAARMRHHQSWYRAVVLGVPCGTGPSANARSPYGNMLTREEGARGKNFLTREIHEVALARIRQGGGTIDAFRLQHNLLSSMPLCFNLFGPLVADLALATRLWRALLGEEVAEVTRVALEYAPVPAADYLADGTAFDAFVEYRRADGALCFTGIETKLTEPFSPREYPKERPGYQRWLAHPSAPWRPDALPSVDRVEHNQLFRDHLLVHAMVARAGSAYAAGRLLLVRHDEDARCAATVAGYRALLRPGDDSFAELPLSRLVGTWEPIVAADPPRAAWLADLRRRYLELSASEACAAPAAAVTPTVHGGAVREGHLHALALVESDAYRTTLDRYAEHLGVNGVYLRPTEQGLTVISTDPRRCPKMLGVGARDSGQEHLSRLPPTDEQVRVAVEGFREKVRTVRDRKPEEQFSLSLLARALGTGLGLPESLHLVCQEWRLPTEDGGDKLDLLAVDLSARALVVVELKRSHDAARAPDRHGRDAAAQADHYADLLHQHRQALYPYFQRLARALARHHDGPEAMRTLLLDPEQRPRALVWTP